MAQVFSFKKKKKTLKKNTGQMVKRYWKSQGILLVQKSGDDDLYNRCNFIAEFPGNVIVLQYL